MRLRPVKPITTPKSREPRIKVAKPLRAALFLCNGREKVCGWVRQLNTSGMYLQNKARFPPETEVFMEALIWEGEAARQLKIKGWVAYEDNFGMGIQFDRPDPETRSLLTRFLRNYDPSFA